jgi:hypothetical protein
MFRNSPLSRNLISSRRTRPLTYTGAGLATISLAFLLLGTPQAAADIDINKCAMLAKGYRGGCVNELQKQLHANLSNDGKFGPKTKQAVVDFQKSRGLTPDGIVGPETKLALRSSDYVNSPRPQPYVNSPTPKPKAPPTTGSKDLGPCLIGRLPVSTTMQPSQGCAGGTAGRIFAKFGKKGVEKIHEYEEPLKEAAVDAINGIRDARPVP